MSDAASPNRTIYCGFCSAQLSYPVGSWVIQCPKCNGQQDPSAQQQTRCSNQACNAMLSHPPDSLYIQCPKCENTMNAREEPRLGFVGGSLQASQSKSSLPKKRKDPAAPRAAMNAYMIFCKERRPALSEQYPELGFGQVGSKLGEVWRNMSVTEKKPYEDRAFTDRERYKKEFSQFNKTAGTSASKKIKDETPAAPAPVVEAADEDDDDAEEDA